MGLGAERNSLISALAESLTGRAWQRGEPGFEAACCATVVNERRPAARPDCVVAAGSIGDVVTSVRLAGERGWRIAVRSGGHSWSGAHLRGDGLLLDVSALNDLAVDVEREAATGGPGVRSSDLQVSLAEHGLFFPTGHCTGPCLGGYLLQGGFGWHSRTLGLGCMNVLAIDLVTADGEVVHADASENSDLYWAARGAGPGFFGVVVRFHLQLHPRPPAMWASSQLYPIELLDEVMTWAHGVSPRVPESIELMVFMRRELMGRPGTVLKVLAPALAESADQAHADLAFLDESPLRDQALSVESNAPTDVVDLVRGSDDFYPPGYRYSADNMWTSAPVGELLPAYRRIASTLPTSPSHMMWMNWRPPSERPDMAFSLEDDVYMALYAVWQDEREDKRVADWPTQLMREFAPLSSGIQLADENLARRPARFMDEENLSRLEQLRAKYDPAGRFPAWPGTV